MAGSMTSLRYPRTARLLRPEDFTALRRAAKRLSLRFFQCEYRMTEASSARLGMAVSRRVSKRAVVRNRIRRQIRESFRLQRARLPICDVLVTARSLAAEQDNKILRVELDLLWSKLAALQMPLNEAGPTGTMRGS
jgi:ribonuclease P protein component